MNSRLLVLLFWIAAIGFFTWDWMHSPPVNTYAEPPLVAAGSGVAPSGAHCAATF
ncbi:MAG TPA: hypothetical protein VF265_05465 [Nevskiaceae bacterium]